MSLSKQLSLLIIAILITVFIGSFSIGLHSTRVYLSEQLQTHAQDTATSLGLSLSHHMQNNDQATIMSMIDAVYDRGYFTKITVADISGTIVVQRQSTDIHADSPKWFMRLFPLPTPSAQAIVQSGWNQTGEVSVKSNPAFAYQELWRSSLGLCFWLACVALFAMIFSVFAIRKLFQPLNDITKQAQAICNKEFYIQEKIPKTWELKRVTEAMNRMVSRLKQIFFEQASNADVLREQAFTDPVTKLSNRRSFNDHMAHRLSANQEFFKGFLLLLEIQGLSEFNQKNGYEVGDQLLAQIAHLLKQACQDYKKVFVARLGGASFSIVIEQVTKDQISLIADKLIGQLSCEIQVKDRNKLLGAHMGGVEYQQGMELTHLLSAADSALRAAKQRRTFAFQLLSDKSYEPGKSSMQWRDQLNNALLRDRFVCYSQAVLSDDKQVKHQEVYVRLKEDNKIISAFEFMPVAEQYHFATLIDKTVVGKIISLITEHHSSDNYAINLSVQSLTDENFLQYLSAALTTLNQKQRKQLSFEITEFAVIHHLQESKRFNEFLTKHQVGFGLDQFGASLSPLGYLCSLTLDYVKLDGSYTRNITRDREKQFFIQTISYIANTLQFDLIGANVETEQEWHSLSKFGVKVKYGIPFADLRPIQLG